MWHGLSLALVKLFFFLNLHLIIGWCLLLVVAIFLVLVVIDFLLNGCSWNVLVHLDVLINPKRVDLLTTIVLRDKATNSDVVIFCEAFIGNSEAGLGPRNNVIRANVLASAFPCV